jgi:signal peptidase I
MLEKELKRVESGIRFRRTLRSTVFTLVVVAAIAVLAATLLLPVMQIYGASMMPTLREGDVVVSIKTGRADPGELVAFYYGNKVLVKRCIGTSGDLIDMDEAGNVSVNGEPLEEPYLAERAFGECDIALPYQVPDGRFFVMGDQRETSIDSRNTLVGCIASEQMIGRIIFRIWPLNQLGTVR